MNRPLPTSLETKIGQMLFVGFDGLEPPDYLLEWLRQGRVGGVILFSRNIDTPSQVAALTDRLQAAATYGVIISIDQEGGTVSRLRDGFTESPGAMALASAIDSESLTERVSRMLAEELRALGIHWNYAPTVDISYNAANPSIGTRAFGSDPERVSALAAAAVRGFQSAGIAASAKHFPGLGDTPIDTHIDLPALNTPLTHLLQVDLMPYRAAIAADVASVMVTHVLYRSLDADHPCTLSPIVVHRLLRDYLRYEGVVTTDCLEMQAITNHYGAGESAVLAALAGIDAILFSHTRSRQEAAYDALLSAARSGRLPDNVVENANRRLATFKQTYLLPRADLSLIRSREHVLLADEAARAGTTLLHQGSALPLTGQVGVIEFASTLESGIGDVTGLTGFSRSLRARLPGAEIVTLTRGAPTTSAEQMAASAETLVLAVRSVHLSDEKVKLARSLISKARRTVLVCLRNPYDADVLPGVDTAICTCGDSAPSLAAAVAALMGDFAPTGSLPVAVEIT